MEEHDLIITTTRHEFSVKPAEDADAGHVIHGGDVTKVRDALHGLEKSAGFDSEAQDQRGGRAQAQPF
jgi:hypothetical protein